jgi:hypothetical protein
MGAAHTSAQCGLASTQPSVVTAMSSAVVTTEQLHASTLARGGLWGYPSDDEFRAVGALPECGMQLITPRDPELGENLVEVGGHGPVR